MGHKIVAGGQLRFDISGRYESTDFYDHPLRNPWDIHQPMKQQRVISIELIAVKQLTTENSFSRSIAIIDSVQIGDVKPPVEMARLGGIETTFNGQNSLRKLGAIGNNRIA